MRQLLQSVTILLQSATGITKCDDYYKVRQYRRIGVALQVTVENTERSGVICDLGYSKIFTVDTVNRLWFTVESSKTSCDRVTNPV